MSLKQENTGMGNITRKIPGESLNNAAFIDHIDIPVGRAKTEEIIKCGFYADKTDYIRKFFRGNAALYFFIRPRRFGKSLFLDTIDQIAKGNKELFKHCAIGQDKTYEWKKYPVIKLDFSRLATDNAASLTKSLNRKLYDIATNYGVNDKINVTIEENCKDYVDRLINLLTQIDKLEKTPIVLVDEYDHPLIKTPEGQYEDNFSVIDNFFTTLKSLQNDCKFIFVTGVTKFHLSGLESGFNSGNDISLHDDYAEMLGYTEQDIHNLFFKNKGDYINKVIEHLKIKCGKGEDYTPNNLKQDLKDYYNGYYFTQIPRQSVYNPDSILKFFKDKSFGNYWSNSGNPSILLKQMRRNINRFNIEWEKDRLKINKHFFEYVSGSLREIPLIPLMYQTGYFTLDPDGFKNDRGEDKNITDYYLKFPNEEVRSALKPTLAKVMDEVQAETGKQYSTSILNALRTEKWLTFLNIIRSDCLAKAGYRFLDRTEKSFQSALYLFLNGAFHTIRSMQAGSEMDSGLGRSDIVMSDQYNGESTVYILELKVDKPSLKALEQIHSQRYGMQYGSCHKKVLIGLKYGSIELNISEAVVEVHRSDSEETDFYVMPRRKFILDSNGYFIEIGPSGTY